MRIPAGIGTGAMVRIIGLKAYRTGYTGFLENDEAYIFFNTARGEYRPVQSYPKSDFENYHHFTTLMSKFVNQSFFLKTPVNIARADKETLDKIYADLKARHKNP